MRVIARYAGLTGSITHNDPPKSWQLDLDMLLPRIPNVGESFQGPDHVTYVIDQVAWSPFGEPGYNPRKEDPQVSGPYVMLILRAG